MLRFLIVCLFMFTVACGDDDSVTSTDPLPHDSESEDTEEPEASWVFERVEDADVGLQSKIAMGPGDVPGVAYWANASFDDGICDAVEVNPPRRMRQDLKFAERIGGQWSVETVVQPVVIFSPNGLSLLYDNDGNPTIAYTGGDPEAPTQHCGSHNAVLAARSGQEWTMETASAESGESATGEPASDAGSVVGLWPALAFDSQGQPAVLHKDAHFGSLQHDDKYRADAEFAWNNGGWLHEAVDAGEGAGDYGSLVFDNQGRPVSFYAITVEAQGESRHGVWAARRDADGQWERVRLHTGAIYQETSAKVDPLTGDLVVAFYSAKDFAVRIRRLTDHESFTEASAWEDELVGDARFDEGRHVSLAFTPSGKPALAYHRCKRVTSTSGGCDPSDEAVVFAIKGTSKWSISSIADSPYGSCGAYTSLAIDSNGIAYLSYTCAEMDDDGPVIKLFVANKEIE